MVRDPANFFKFGVVTVHVKGSFPEGTFLLVDDSLAVFGSQCSNNSRPALRLATSTRPGWSRDGWMAVCGRPPPVSATTLALRAP